MQRKERKECATQVLSLEVVLIVADSGLKIVQIGTKSEITDLSECVI